MLLAYVSQSVACDNSFHREPDSTYYELPAGSQQGERPLASTSTPGCHCSAAESSMDIYHLRDMNDNVMVGQWATFWLPQWPLHKKAE